jgi:hypothetical protein
MAVTADEIRSFDGKAISLAFSDGCSMDVKIIETMHIEEGDDFIAHVLKIHCQSTKHSHPAIGESINIRLTDTVSLKPLGNDDS